MTLKTTIIIVLLFLFNIATAQEKPAFVAPDYKQIEKATKDKKSSNYYPKLLERYKSNDTSLTVQEMNLLYYGKFFHSTGKGAKGKYNYNDSIQAVYKKETLSDNDHRNLVRYYLAELDENPFSMKTLNALSNLYYKLNDPVERIYGHKLRKIADVILATGDGIHATSAFHINSVADEYAIIGLLGLEFGGTQSLRGGYCDYLTVSENEYKIEGLYFNVAHILKGYMK